MIYKIGAATVEIIPPKNTQEENQKVIKELERVLTQAYSRKVTITNTKT